MNKERYQAMQRRAEQIAGDLHVAQLVRVERFDPQTMAVDAQPLIRQPEEENANPPLLLDVRVASLCYGETYIRPWLNKGDIGLVVFCDRDTDYALMTGKISDPATPRMHAMEDAFFIGAIGLGTSAKASRSMRKNALVIGAGDQRIEITPEGIDMHGNISVNGINLAAHTHDAPEGVTSPPK